MNTFLSTKFSFLGNPVLIGADLENNTHCYSAYLLLKETLLTSCAGFTPLKKCRNHGELGLFVRLIHIFPEALFDS